MPYFTPKSLFKISLDFVSDNVEYVDSLVGFPEGVGKQIFDHFVTINEDSLLPSTKQVKIIRNFVNAYEILVLKSINLSAKLILLNEYFDSFVVLFSNISELCLCSCYLGDNHEICEQIQNFTLLKKLCLRKNCLKDGALRKITLPVRMFSKGPKNIEHLDLSANNCTDAIAPWLAVFSKLTYLDLSGNNITNKGIREIEKKCLLQLCNIESDIHPIETKGWAAPLVKKWEDLNESRRKARKTKEFTSYFKKKRYTEAEEKMSSMTSSTEKNSSKKVIFKLPNKLYDTNVSQISTKTTLLPKPYFSMDTDEDIFSQYKI